MTSIPTSPPSIDIISEIDSSERKIPMPIVAKTRKKIWDSLYKVFIETSPLAMQIIDTTEYQKMKQNRQLGLVQKVFPGAHHTRFDHCLGVYWLTGVFLDHLDKTSAIANDGKRIMTDRCKELMKIAGLVHDIGHTMFSHLFDKELAASLGQLDHEERGIEIFRAMVTKYKLPILSDEVDFIASLIRGGVPPPCTPTEDFTISNSTSSNSTSSSPILSSNCLETCGGHGVKGETSVPPLWQWQIVSNHTFEIDTDKLDYLMRDSHNIGLPCKVEVDSIIGNSRINLVTGNIEFDSKIYAQVYEVFMTRYQLHRTVYHHKTVLAYEILVVRYLKLIFSITEIRNNWSLFGDEILHDAEKLLAIYGDKVSSESRAILEKCVDIKRMFDSRQIPKLVCKLSGKFTEISETNTDTNTNINTDKSDNTDDSKKFEKSELLKKLDELRRQGYQIHYKNFSIGFCSNESVNPIHKLFFFNKSHTSSSSTSVHVHVPKLLSGEIAHEQITHIYKEKI